MAKRGLEPCMGFVAICGIYSDSARAATSSAFLVRTPPPSRQRIIWQAGGSNRVARGDLGVLPLPPLASSQDQRPEHLVFRLRRVDGGDAHAFGLFSVMAGLVPAIHVLLLIAKKKGVDARVKPGHDENVTASTATPGPAGGGHP